MKRKKIKIKNTLTVLAILMVLAFPFFSLAMNYTPMEQIPGSGTTSDWCTYLSYIYKFGLWAVGIAALLMIGIGGFMYTTSAGNNASMEKAKGVITDAIAGLLLALASWMILNTINPDLLRCSLPASLRVSTISVAVPTPPPAIAPPIPMGPIDTSIASCKPATNCTSCNNCSPVTGIACKESPCYLNSLLLARLQTVSGSPAWRITEPWPPTVYHTSTCHSNGTCADINLLSSVPSTPANVKALSDALRAAGFTSFTYESNNCAPIRAVGVQCGQYATMTSPSFHVNN